MRDLGKWLARSVDSEWTDVLHGLDGLGPEAGRRVKAHGKTWICDRGSAHILTQKRILEEEHAYWEAPAPIFTSEHLERCVAEYEEAHAITVPSQFARRSFLEHGIASERVFVCPYGVDLSEFHPAAKASSIFRVIFVGIASIQKGDRASSAGCRAARQKAAMRALARWLDRSFCAACAQSVPRRIRVQGPFPEGRTLAGLFPSLRSGARVGSGRVGAGSGAGDGLWHSGDCHH